MDDWSDSPQGGSWPVRSTTGEKRGNMLVVEGRMRKCWRVSILRGIEDGTRSNTWNDLGEGRKHVGRRDIGWLQGRMSVRASYCR